MSAHGEALEAANLAEEAYNLMRHSVAQLQEALLSLNVAREDKLLVGAQRMHAVAETVGSEKAREIAAGFAALKDETQSEVSARLVAASEGVNRLMIHVDALATEARQLAEILAS